MLVFDLFLFFLNYQLISDLKIREINESPISKDSIFGRVVPAGSVLESLESKFKKT